MFGAAESETGASERFQRASGRKTDRPEIKQDSFAKCNPILQRHRPFQDREFGTIDKNCFGTGTGHCTQT